MNILKARNFVITFFIVLISLSIGYGIGISGFVANAKSFPRVHITREVPPEKDLDFSLFWNIWDTLQTQYVDKSKLVDSQLVYGAIKGMVQAAGDPYTVFLTPNENKVSQEDLQGSFDGVGIQIGYRGSQLAVIAPLPDTPAEKAGVLPGDYIVGIKDEGRDIDRGTGGMSLPEAVQIIRGAKGSKVMLVLVRDGSEEPIEVELTRQNIEVPSVVLKYVGEGEKVAHLRLLKFGGDTKLEWDKAVSSIFEKQNLEGIVLDLRSNPGGYLQSAVDIASDFLPTGSVVVIEERSDGSKTEYKTTVSPKLSNRDVVVLVNKGSASASEILAGALRDQKKIKILGDTSFGKGTIQEPQQLENGAGLHITIAKWLTPNGTWVHEKGLEPDTKVENKTDTTEDEQLDAAIQQILR